MTRANEAWDSLMRAYAVLMKRFNAEDVWGEVTMREYDVLYTLSKCDSPLRMSELNRHVLLSQPALSRMVDRLVTTEMIVRQHNPATRREVVVELSDDGRRVVRGVTRRRRAAISRIVAKMPEDERRDLVGALTAFTEAGDRADRFEVEDGAIQPAR